MLVLTRKKGEAIAIGKGIIVTVLESDGEKIKIGIDAPRDISVLRYELIQETISVNLEASKSQKGILEQIK